MQQRDMAEENEKGGKKTAVIIAVVAVILAAAVAVVLLMPGRGKDNNDDSEGEDGRQRSALITRDNVGTVLADVDISEADSDADEYVVTMNPSWEFPDGTSESTNAYVENSLANSHAVYFDVLLADTQETVYESPVIPRGKSIEKFALDKDLEAGTYSGIVVYYLIDGDQNVLSQVKVSVTLVVES